MSKKLNILKDKQEFQVESKEGVGRKFKSNSKTEFYNYSSGLDTGLEEYILKPPKLKLDGAAPAQQFKQVT